MLAIGLWQREEDVAPTRWEVVAKTFLLFVTAVGIGLVCPSPEPVLVARAWLKTLRRLSGSGR